VRRAGRIILIRIVTAAILPILLVGLIGTATGYAAAGGELDQEAPVLYYFWGRCPVCAEPEQHLDQFAQYPIDIAVHEVFYDPDSRALYDDFRQKMGIEVYGFPTIVYRDQYWIGFSPAIQEEIRQAIEASLQNRPGLERQNRITVPLFGELNLAAAPIILSTVIISFLDGFNPCSLFVLTFLLAMIVHSASRKRIFLVGFTFLVVTAAVYGLFMIGVLNIMVFAARLFWISQIVSLLVVAMGLVAIKDFLFFKKGFSLSIPDHHKARFYRQVRNVFYTKSTGPMIIATVAMAAGIALIELPCTAGLPVVWSGLVSGLDLSWFYFLFLFALYLIMYLFAELIVFTLAVVRMRTVKLTEEGGRFLKLISGCLMLVLGFVLLFRPEYMENLAGMLVTFGAAAVLISVVYLFRRVFLM
jgi:cytochrome c biogenesis protein CcdA